MFLLFVVLMFVSTYIHVLIVFCVKLTSLCLYLKFTRCFVTFDTSVLFCFTYMFGQASRSECQAIFCHQLPAPPSSRANACLLFLHPPPDNRPPYYYLRIFPIKIPLDRPPRAQTRSIVHA